MSSHAKGHRSKGLLVTAAFIAIVAGGCAEAPQEASAVGPGAVSVDVVNISYATDPLEITAGTDVSWTNLDAGVHHTVTSGRPGDKGVPGLNEEKPAQPDGLFDGDLPDEGASFTFTFTAPGTYEYFCTVHSSMTGKVIVR